MMPDATVAVLYYSRHKGFSCTSNPYTRTFSTVGHATSAAAQEGHVDGVRSLTSLIVCTLP